MPLCLRHDIHKGKRRFVFINANSGQIAAQNFGKNVLLIISVV